MERPTYQDLMRLNEADRKALLDRLDAADSRSESGVTFKADKRKERRWTYRHSPIVVTVIHPGGGVSRYLVHPRNLSAGGMSFVHGGFLHSGTKCRLELVKLDGQTSLLSGAVVGCRHIDGRIHEISLKFERHIEPTAFLRVQGEQAGATESLQLPDLRGRVLYVEDSEADYRLLAHHLRSTGVQLTKVNTDEMAYQALRETRYDIVLCDLNLGKVDGADVIKRIRSEHNFAGPLVVVSAETSGSRVQAALAAGANETLMKPYRPQELFDLMARLHAQAGAVISADAIYSSMEDQAGSSELLEAFVGQARTVAEQLDQAIARGDLARTRELCMNIKGSAWGYGFDALGTAATEALQMLDVSSSISESMPQLRRLSLMCMNIAVRSRPAAPAQQQAA